MCFFSGDEEGAKLLLKIATKNGSRGIIFVIIRLSEGKFEVAMPFAIQKPRPLPKVHLAAESPRYFACDAN